MSRQDEKGLGLADELVSGVKNSDSIVSDESHINIESLAELTGFPIDFIKTELLLNHDSIKMGDLRKSMAKYLERTVENLS